MKRILLALIIIAIATPTVAQSFDLKNGDTINVIDASRKRQGYWIVEANPSQHKGYQAGTIYEEGKYENSRKIGVWKVYFPNKNLKSKITYVNSIPKGPYTLYYENGNIEEEGNWDRTKNTGAFKRYHENGKVSQDFTFSESGKRTGKQTYYYDNGNLRLEGSWEEGRESGEMREYYENGDLRAVKQFKDGVLNTRSIEEYAPKTPQKDALEKQIAEGKDINERATADEKPNQGAFDGNGYRKLYNRNLQIVKDGVFKNFRLIDGKSYQYDDNGILGQIRIFKDGKYIGDGVLPKEDAP